MNWFPVKPKNDMDYDIISSIRQNPGHFNKKKDFYWIESFIKDKFTDVISRAAKS